MISRELLRKFQQGSCTPDELAVLRSCMENGTWAELEKMLDEDWHSTSFKVSDLEARERVKIRLLASLKKQQITGAEDDKADFAEIPGTQPRWWRSIAASLAFLILAGLGYLLWNKHDGYQNGELVEEMNNDSKPEKISLDDGSVVWLYPGSKLHYPHSFLPGLRQVSLDGEAFFSVAKDTSRPFLVETSTLLVKVLGTSFSVKSQQNKKASEVSVRSGRVTVSRQGGKSDILLLPNERISFLENEIQPVKKLAETPVIIDQKVSEAQFQFSSIPVAEVFEMLRKAYRINIIYDPLALKNCTLTARLCDQPLFTKLEMICGSIGANYIIKDTSIYITVTDGCDQKEQ